MRVSFTDDIGHAEALTSAATEAVAAEPNISATGRPAITGTARMGATLTVDTSGIRDDNGLDNVAFAYRWFADDIIIDGATGSSYRLTSAEDGKAIKVRISFTDDAGYGEALTSAATDAVAAMPNIAAVGTPIIIGTLRAGETLTSILPASATTTGLDDVAYTYQWLANDIEIDGATGSSYRITSDEVGKSIGVRVSSPMTMATLKR